jgi:hypothetical protein
LLEEAFNGKPFASSTVTELKFSGVVPGLAPVKVIVANVNVDDCMPISVLGGSRDTSANSTDPGPTELLWMEFNGPPSKAPKLTSGVEIIVGSNVIVRS